MTVVDAARTLRNYPVFARASLRHLSDLAELARKDQQLVRAGDTADIDDAAFIVVLSGNRVVLSGGRADDATFAMSAGGVFWTMLVRFVRAGTMAMGHPGAITAGTGTAVPIEGITVHVETEEDALVLPLTMATLGRAAHASTSFATTVDLRPVGGTGSLFDFLV